MSFINKRTALKVWQDVIFAILIREMRSQFSDKFGLSWSVLNPVIFIFALSYGRGLISGEYTHTMPTFIFMLYGMLIIQLFMNTLQSASNSIKKNKALFAFRQVQPISAVIANCLFELLIKVAVVIILFLIIYLMKIDAFLKDPLVIIFYIFQVWILALSLGLLIAIGKAYVGEVEKISQLIQRPLFFLSAVFFSLQDIPVDFWPFLDWNPILHAIELSRDAAYPTFNAVGVSSLFLSTVTLSCLFFSLACYRITWKKIVSL